MSGSHTPGPWSGNWVRMGGDASITGNDRLIASVHPKSMRAHDISGDAERDANARMIAAAPDLAASLSDMLRILEAVKLSAGLGKKQIERVERAKAVLAANSINPEN